MKSRVQKWGNSLAVRIPKSFAQEAHLSANAAVELTVADGALTVRPIVESPTLADLVRGITDANRHDEWDTGPAVGREVW